MADKMYAGVKALIEKDGKYLFVGYELGGEMLWILPGGRLKHGESPLEGLKREVKGEVSLKIEPGDPIGMYHFFIGEEDDGDQVSLTVFEAENYNGEIDIDTEHAAEDELEEYKWMSPEQIRKNNVTDTLRQLLEQEIF